MSVTTSKHMVIWYWPVLTAAWCLYPKVCNTSIDYVTSMVKLDYEDPSMSIIINWNISLLQNLIQIMKCIQHMCFNGAEAVYPVSNHVPIDILTMLDMLLKF